MPIKGWMGSLKSPTQSFMPAGIMAASPDRLDRLLCCDAGKHAPFSYWVQIGKNSMTCWLGQEDPPPTVGRIESGQYVRRLSCCSAPGQIAGFRFISFLSSQLPGYVRCGMLLHSQGKIKLNFKDHHFLYHHCIQENAIRTHKNKFNAYIGRSPVRDPNVVGGTYSQEVSVPLCMECVCQYIPTFNHLNESSVLCNCNVLHNPLPYCRKASGTDEYVS